MKRQKIFLTVASIALFTALSHSTSAQKLPQVQQVSLRAPANVRIDGKNTEWGKMKAYNKATGLEYAIANDDEKLYLVVQVKDKGIQDKVVMGGLTLVIQKTGEKSDKGARLVKFPYFKEKARNMFWSFDMVNREGDNNFKINDPDGKILAGKIATANKNLRSNVKWIYTKNLSGVDSVLSIYNEAGIEAMNTFDSSTKYTSELAIDLNLLGLSAKDASKFSYHILVDDNINKRLTGFTIVGDRSSIGPDGKPLSAEQIERSRKFIDEFNVQMSALAATTDFWGEYTLAK